MRFEHDVAWLWEERADSRNVCLKLKEVSLILYYIDKNSYHFIKEDCHIVTTTGFNNYYKIAVRTWSGTFAKILAYMTYVGKYQKAYIRCHTLYLVIFLTKNFLSSFLFK